MQDDVLTSNLLGSVVSPLGGNNNTDHSLITELLLGPTDSMTTGNEVFPATSLLAKDQQALQEIAASLPWEASSNDMVRCIPNGPVHVAAAAAAPVGGHQSGGKSTLASGLAVGMESVGSTTQSGCTVQKMELPLLLSGMKAAYGPSLASLGRLQGNDHIVCAATEVGGRRGGTSNSVNLLPPPLQGEDKIALACKDKWKLVGGLRNMCSCMHMAVCISDHVVPLIKVLQCGEKANHGGSSTHQLQKKR